MNADDRARAVRIREAFGPLPRMRAETSAGEPVVIMWCNDTVARVLPDAPFRIGTTRHVLIADLFPDPADEGNLGLMLGVIRRRLDMPKLVELDVDTLCSMVNMSPEGHAR